MDKNTLKNINRNIKFSNWKYDSILQSRKRLIMKDGKECYELKDSINAPIQNWGGIDPYLSIEEHNRLLKEYKNGPN